MLAQPQPTAARAPAPPRAAPRAACARTRRPRTTTAAAAAAATAPTTAAVAPAGIPAVPYTPKAALPEGIANGVSFFSPPLTDDPAAMMARRVPFLTTQAGTLPVVPSSLDNALYNYGEYTSKYVSVRVDDTHVKLTSWDHAVQSLRDAHANGSSYWCSLLEAVRHPAWWPAEGHVPNYDQVIFGRGNASIGNHFDKDNVCAGGSRRPVSTYLAMCEGAKLVLLLPPDQTLLPAGGDSSKLLHPTPEFLEAVRSAGGHFFILENVAEAPTAAAGNASSGSSSGSSSGGSSSGGSMAAGRLGGAGGRKEFSATALYMPTGWWHWVVGLTDWHVVYGGSHY